jgi:cyclophilin family peptidyl-prolyl cis-trans isomerase
MKTINIVLLEAKVKVMKNHYYFLLVCLLIPAFLFTSCKKKNDDSTPPTPADTLNVNLGPDKTILEGDSVILDPGHPGSTYLWSTGATTQTIVADTTGTFWVKVTNGTKTSSDTVSVMLSYKLSLIETDFGNMLIWLYPKTPLHRKNFIKLSAEHFYDSLIFHRVIKDFVEQGGDPLGTGYGGPGYTIPAEIRADILHAYGAVGAARLADNVNPNRESNGSQFYIVNNKAGTPNLDGRYTVFGIVINGFPAVDSIAVVPTYPSNNRPIDNVYMKKVRIVNYTANDLKNEFGFVIP